MSNKVKTSRNLQIGQMMAISIIAISLVHCIGEEVGSISDDESITDSDGSVSYRSHEAQGYEEHEEHEDQEPQELRDSVEYTRARV